MKKGILLILVSSFLYCQSDTMWIYGGNLQYVSIYTSTSYSNIRNGSAISYIRSPRNFSSYHLDTTGGIFKPSGGYKAISRGYHFVPFRNVKKKYIDTSGNFTKEASTVGIYLQTGNLYGDSLCFVTPTINRYMDFSGGLTSIPDSIAEIWNDMETGSYTKGYVSLYGSRYYELGKDYIDYFNSKISIDTAKIDTSYIWLVGSKDMRNAFPSESNTTAVGYFSLSSSYKFVMVVTWKDKATVSTRRRQQHIINYHTP